MYDMSNINVNQEKRKWRNAVVLANADQRIVVCNKKVPTIQPIVPPVQIDIEEEQQQEVQQGEVQQQVIGNEQNQKTDLRPDWRRYCSVCGRCSTVEHPLLFSTVPIIPKIPNRSTKDYHRKVYYSQMNRRRMYLSRLNLKHKKGTKYIYLCDQHELCSELVTIKYINKTGQQLTYDDYITVPINQKKE
jgi:hypothetical protein